MREKGFNKGKQLMSSKWVQYQKVQVLYIDCSTFVFHIYTFSVAGNIIVYTPSQDTIEEKNFNHIIFKRKMPSLAGNKHLSVQFFFHLSIGKSMCSIRHKWTSKWLFQRWHNTK